MSATFLVTGFEPFREHRTNSSWAAFARARRHWSLRRRLDELQPAAVLCTGLAQGRVLRVELCVRPPTELVECDDQWQPALVRGRWPWAETRRALERSGIDVTESEDAGLLRVREHVMVRLAYPSDESPAPSAVWST